MNRCNRCGTALKDGARFCPACGMPARIAEPDRGTGTVPGSGYACPSCGAVSPAGVRFCPGCGMPAPEGGGTQKNVCPSCGAKNPAGVRFCLGCGASAQAFTTAASRPAPGIPAARKTVRRSRRKLVISATALCLAAAITAGIFFREPIARFFAGGPGADDGEEAKAVLSVTLGEGSGTKAFEVSPAGGLTVSAEENALDKERSFTAYRLEEKALYELASSFPYDDRMVLDAYELDAGLGADEYFPGLVRLEIDLKELEIPEEAWDSVRLVRVGADGSVQSLTTTVEGSKAACLTNRNSVIVTTVLLAALSAVAGYFVRDDLGEKYLWKFPEYKNMKYHYADTVKGYNIYWPDSLPSVNPQGVKDLWDEAERVAQRIEEENRKATEAGYRQHMRAATKSLFSDPDYKSLMEKASDEKWKRENLWPMEVTLTVDAVRAADKYLFEKRGFRRPGFDVDVGVLSPWPYPEAQAYGFSFNPKLGTSYIHINAANNMVPDTAAKANSDAYQHGISALYLTVVHELFHVVQSGYVPVDWGANLWFWEATALVLEEEALRYYAKGPEPIVKFSSDELLTEAGYYETLVNSMGIRDYWGSMSGNELFARHQGYTASNFFKFMRDRYYAKNPDDFLPLILKEYTVTKNFGRFDEVLKNITSSNEQAFLTDFRLYCTQLAPTLAAQTKLVAEKASEPYHALVKDSVYNLEAGNPALTLAEIGTQYKPLSVRAKTLKIKVDDSRYGSVYLVLKTGKDFVQKEGTISFRVSLNGKTGFQNLKADGYTVFQDVKTGDAAVIEIDDFETWDSLKPSEGAYEAFLMAPPAGPALEVKENKLVVTMPEGSVLRRKGIVTGYDVFVVGPDGVQLTASTEDDKLEIPLNSSGGIADDYAQAHMVEEALRDYLEKNPDKKRQYASEAGGQEALDKAIGSAASMFDYQSMQRAAEVLAGGAEKKYVAWVSERIEQEDKSILHGPLGEKTELSIDSASTAGVDILGTWQGSAPGAGAVTVTIGPGAKGHDYTIDISLYSGEVDFYGDDNGNGTVAVTGGGFECTLIKNSDKELYLTAPPITLHKK